MNSHLRATPFIPSEVEGRPSTPLRVTGVGLNWLALLVALAGTAALAQDDVKVSTEPFEGSDTPFSLVEGTVNAPAAEVWAIVSRCADFAKTMPRIAKATELWREGDETRSWTAKCVVTAELPFPFSNLTGTTLATHTVQPGVKYVREWSLVSGDYDFNQGSWTVVATDEGRSAWVRYRIHVSPKLHLPSSWIARAQRETMKDLILKLRDDVKKNGPPRP